MNTSSLRLRLLFAWVVFIALLLQIAGIGLRILFERSITRRTQIELTADLRQIKRGMSRDNEGALYISRKPTDPQFDIEFGGRYWQVTEAGKVVARSASLKNATLAWPERIDTASGSTPASILGPQKERLFAVVEDYAEPSTKGDRPHLLRIITAVDASEIREDTDKFSTDLFASLVILAVILIAGAVAQVFIGLKPLEVLRGRVQAVRRGNALQIEGQFPTEIMPLVHETNELLLAQHKALSDARQRAGNLAHGLNTPLAILNAKSRQLQIEGKGDIAREIDRQVVMMQRHVERELARARARGAKRHGTATVDIVQLVEPLISAIQALPRAQCVEWDISLPQRAMVHVEADDFNNMSGNIIENAVKWTRTKISILVSQNDSSTSIIVEDDGPGIEECEIPRLMKRGERADLNSPGTGLGLAIVCDIVDLYSGQLLLSRSALGGLMAEIRIPKTVVSA